MGILASQVVDEYTQDDRFSQIGTLQDSATQAEETATKPEARSQDGRFSQTQEERFSQAQDDRFTQDENAANERFSFEPLVLVEGGEDAEGSNGDYGGDRLGQTMETMESQKSQEY